VGNNGALSFSPDTTKASVGDIVDFYFHLLHSIIRGDLSNPCAAAKTGGFSLGLCQFLLEKL
jgi:plastocyanin